MNITDKEVNEAYGFDKLSNYQLLLGAAEEHALDNGELFTLRHYFDSTNYQDQRHAVALAKRILKRGLKREELMEEGYEPLGIVFPKRPRGADIVRNLQSAGFENISLDNVSVKKLAQYHYELFINPTY
jgi:hypothetical protein